MDHSADANPNASTGLFVERLTHHQRDLAAYIHALVGHWADTEEVLQETNTRLWEQQERYDVSRPFLPWARTVAHYQVLAHRTNRRRRRMQFNQDLIETLARETETMSDHLEARRHALDACVEKLTDSARRLVELCYFGGLKIRDVASRLGRGEAATYKQLARARRTLHECIEQQVGETA